jgi:hypothetical protein
MARELKTVSSIVFASCLKSIYELSAISYQLSAVSNQPSAISYQLLAVGNPGLIESKLRGRSCAG